MKDIKNNLKKSDTWEVQLTVAINFTSSKDNDEELVIHSKSGNIEIMIYEKADILRKNFLNHFFLDIKLGWKHKWFQTLFCSIKNICIIKRNNVKTCWWYLLLELSSFVQSNKFKSHKKVCKDKDICSIVIPSEDNKILAFNRCQISNESQSII